MILSGSLFVTISEVVMVFGPLHQNLSFFFSVVTLLDYGAGNVRSVRNAIRFLGFDIKDVSFLHHYIMGLFLNLKQFLLNASWLVFLGLEHLRC